MHVENNFTVLMVCTGNICRSPFAEYLLANLVQDINRVNVSSAGTNAMVGERMSPETQTIAESYGVENFESHRARQLSEEILGASDLILTMTRRQRRKVVELEPRVTRRVFTLREFARLVAATTDEMLASDLAEVSFEGKQPFRAAVQSIALSRSQLSSISDPAEDEVVDPYGHSLEVHQASAQQLVPAVNTLAKFLMRVSSETVT